MHRQRILFKKRAKSDFWQRKVLLRWLVMVLLGFIVLMVINLLVQKTSWLGIGPYRILKIYTGADKKISNLTLYEIFPEIDMIRAIELPGDLLMKTWGYPGTYRLSAIATLSKKETGNMRMLMETIQYAMGTYINRYEVIEGSERKTDNNNRDLWLGVGWEVLMMRIPFNEGFHLINDLRGKLNQEIKVLTLLNIGAINKITEVDGLDYFSFDGVGFDEWYQRSTPVVSANLRSFSISIENATNEQGLGTQIARLYSHQGFDVIRVGDSSITPQTTILFGNESVGKSAPGIVARSLLPQAAIKVTNIDEYRSSGVVRLGLDFVK